MSHPAWVCGLKRILTVKFINYSLSHPAWVCGLKQTLRNKTYTYDSHTLRGCVD